MNELTNEEKRIRIANACGIQVEPCTCSEQPWRNAETKKHLPDYLNSLDAMHEAEKCIVTTAEKGFFAFNLHYVVDGVSELDSYFATAAQRAEAFARTLNLW